ncbi:hypothetical protein KGQ20_20645 [Catenulispora sp. NF23]|uniref:hypothetical protein n=1 Tax=Catenulispora pinistramenti TaxID=2705254 RepID=UPI001BA62AA5|nr:hypothetical protein [Catenulispora pinistramenti]MBS2535176.1 hypothetical protein [Catenulispora pinistramenti]
MSESAIFEFGSTVYCSDAGCGELLQVVVEPELPRLTGLVVCSIADAAVHLVPAELARPTRYGVLLECDRHVFEGLPAAVPDAQPRIRRGDHAHALDGDAGRVLGLVVRAEDDAITHVVLLAGHVWHRKHVAMPVEYVVGLGFAGLDVLVLKDHVGEFATVDGGL